MVEIANYRAVCYSIHRLRNKNEIIFFDNFKELIIISESKFSGLRGNGRDFKNQ